MQFKNPELLYALFLLLIPILIHLFQLRKFKIEPFTNVAFLKELKLNSRKSHRLKKWLILTSRLLFLLFIILAFAQPFYSKYKGATIKKETVVYLDNSFSLQAKGSHGELYQKALQDLILKFPENENISLFTNTNLYRNTTIKAIKNALLKEQLCANQLSYKAALLKGKSLFSKNDKAIKRFIFISDFQNNSELFPSTDKKYQLDLVKLTPENTNNTYVDSIYMSKKGINTKELVVKIKSNGNGSKQETLPVSLYNDNVLVTKSSVGVHKDNTLSFTLPNTDNFVGKISFNDNQLAFDNDYYFSLKKQDFIHVLEIKTKESNPFLKRIYTDDEFKFSSILSHQLDYSQIENQHTIILNELEEIPSSLIIALSNFKKNNGTIVVIPSVSANISSYNSLLQALNFGSYTSKIITKEKRVTTINYDHPLFGNNVFEKRLSNFQYPKVNSFYQDNFLNTSKILSYDSGNSFLASKNHVYVFTSSLKTKNSNFTLQNLTVPTFYNMALFSLPKQKIQYYVGEENTISIKENIDNDGVISLKSNTHTFIPLQRKQRNHIIITTNEIPEISGHYNAIYNNKILQTLSYNYTKKESHLTYHNLNGFKNVSDNLTNVIINMQSDFKINALWKWFVIFALVFLAIEMLLIKFLK